MTELIFTTLCFAITAFAMALFVIVPVKKVRTDVGRFEPKTAVIIPCKGNGEDFVEFLLAIDRQTLRQVEYLFCFSSAHDPAIPLIHKHIKNQKYQIIQSKPLINTGDKIQNLLAGLTYIRDVQVVAFLDADGSFGPHYLSELILPLSDQSVFVSSTYRNYVAKSFGGLIVKYWNLMSCGVKRFPLSKFVWAGGMAFRHEDLMALELETLWEYRLSDDMSLNHALKRKRKNIATVQRYVQSTAKHTVFEAFQWIARQEFMTRHYFKPVFFGNLIAAMTFLSISTIGVLMGYWATIIPWIGLLSAFVANAVWAGKKSHIMSMPIFFPMVLFAVFYAIAKNLWAKTITWAGIEYVLDRHGIILSKREVCFDFDPQSLEGGIALLSPVMFLIEILVHAFALIGPAYFMHFLLQSGSVELIFISLLMMVMIYPFGLIVGIMFFFRLFQYSSHEFVINSKFKLWQFTLNNFLRSLAVRTQSSGYFFLFPFPGALFYKMAGSQIHPSAVLSSNDNIWDPGCVQIGRQANIGAGAKLISHIVNDRGVVTVSRVAVGDSCVVGANALIYGGAKIGNKVLIGAGSVIGPKAKIDEGAIIKPLSVVKGNTHVGEGEIWAGNPAKKIGTKKSATFIPRFRERQIHPRYECLESLSLNVGLEGAQSSMTHFGTVKNISLGGMCVEGIADRVKLGETIRFSEQRISENQSTAKFCGTARVVWKEINKNITGMKFLDLPSKEHLEELVTHASNLIRDRM